MSKKELLNGEATIIQRMLQLVESNDIDYASNDLAWLSVLGTRVQMGQTTFSVASKLVGYSYANLVAVSQGGNDHSSTKIFFPPDPVCARLAMCLMDEKWSMPEIVKGKEKTWWVEKIKEVYSKKCVRLRRETLGKSWSQSTSCCVQIRCDRS